MTSEGWIITVLVGFLGLSGGIAFAHFVIVRKLNDISITVATQGRDIKSAYVRIENCERDHRETLHVITNVVDQNKNIITQNNLLIQKITVEPS